MIVGHAAIERELAGLRDLDETLTLRADRGFAFDPIKGVREALAELLLVLPLPGQIRVYDDIQVVVDGVEAVLPSARRDARD